MAKQRAYIYQDHSGFIFVYPGVTVIKPGDDFELINTLPMDAEWSVNAGPFEGGAVNKEPIKSHKASPAKVAKKAPFLVTQYEVKVGGFKAIAHSDPVIIIDP